MTDLVIRGGTLVTPHGSRRADLAIDDGCIAAIMPELPGGAGEVDARGLLVLPGLIDVHVHLNDPGRTAWEGAATGSRALAATGGTVLFDMPLNAAPCTVDAPAFDLKRRALEAASVTDFGLWGGLTPGSVDAMPELAARGVVGFKAFMCDSGLPEFPRADDATLVEGFCEAARLGLPVAVHAEDQEVLRALGAGVAVRDARDFAASRPVAAELEAVGRVLALARETGAAIHIVHASCGRAVAMVAEARQAGVDVSIETCPHYLVLTGEDMERLGTVAKCAPPLRPAADQRHLWGQLLSGHVDMVASDHSPVDPAMKAGGFGSAWGGIAGVQSTLPILLDRGCREHGLPLERIAALVAGEPARRFRIAGKGSFAVGRDADLVLVAPADTFVLEPGQLHQRHKVSPYLGMTFRGAVRRTIRRGETIFEDGRIVARGTGRLVRPALHSSRPPNVG